jgi:hypothetical protein
MPTLTLFRQARGDGGIRTGLEYEGWVIFEHFQPGADESDPALNWYVDVRCEGRSLSFPKRDLARQWMLERGDKLAPALLELARELHGGGIDVFWPLKRVLSAPAPGVKAALVVAGIRRRDALDIAAKLRALGQHWEEILQQLEPV